MRIHSTSVRKNWKQKIIALKSFILEQFFVMKQIAKIDTGYSLRTASGDGNSALTKSLLDQTE